MSLRRFIPQKDTFIVAAREGYRETNFGKDEILELGRALESSTLGPARILVQFAQEDLESITDLVGEHEYRAVVHLDVARALNLPETLEITGVPITESWDEGFGKASEEGNMLGATWTYRMPGVPWTFSGNSSFTEEVEGEESENISESLASELTVSTNQSGYQDMYALNLDITDIVKHWIVDQTSNHGLMIQFHDEEHWANEYGTHISFFSADTHTVYQPYLEIKWDDSEFDQGSSIPENSNFRIIVSNLQSEYHSEDLIRFEVSAKNLYPSRVFTTSSLYSSSYALPEGTLWGIKDEYTSEMVVAFDENYTKVSSEGNRSCFTFDMGMLYPERYYRLLFKVPSDSESKVVDNKIIFKVVRNGRT